MQVGKINGYYSGTNRLNTFPSFERRLREEEKADYQHNAIERALQYLGTQSVAMILHGSCNPVIENDLGVGSPINAGAEKVIKLEQLHGFNANQLGPMGEVTRGEISPYSASVFAQNRLFIDFAALTTDEYANLISKDELYTLKANYTGEEDGIAYSKFFDAFENTDKLIADAYDNFKIKIRAKDPKALKLLDEYKKFRELKGEKLLESAVFEVLSKTYGTRDIDVWESPLDRDLIMRLHQKDKEAVERYRQILLRSKDDINHYMFGHFILNKQLKENKDFRQKQGFIYINDNLIGNDNSEFWMYKDCFLPDFRIGCPEGGENNGPQLWGIPVLNPKKLFNLDGSLGPAGIFLKEKLEAGLEYCENIRFDHALGLVDPYIYDKRSVTYVDGHLDYNKFYGRNISELPDIDPDGQYRKILSYIVLPVLKEHGLTPEEAVWEDLGNSTAVFNHIYREKLHLPGMTQLHWDRGQNANKENAFLMGSHDEESAISLVKNQWLQSSWNNGNSAWNPDYLSGYLNSDPARVKEKNEFKAKIINDPMERIKAKFAEMFLSGKRIQIPFTDFFGIEQRYNEKGTKSAYNWKLRLSNNFEDAYYKNLESDYPTALNMPEILKMAVRGKADEKIVSYINNYKAAHGGEISIDKVENYRQKINKEAEPILQKLGYYEGVLKEKSEQGAEV